MAQEIEVPSHFTCPISMQLMKDPVIVSTGITYDREHIEKWLLTCKNKFCPVTKQVLSDDTDPTPNHTLRRLIQSWCILNNFDRIPTPKPPLDKSQILKLLKEAKKSPQNRLECLKNLRSVCQASPMSVKFLEQNGAVEFLALLINNREFVDEALDLLYNFQVSDTSLKQLVNDEFFESLVFVLKSTNFQSRVHAIILLKSLLHVADPALLIRIQPQVVIEVVNLLKDNVSHQASKSALKLLIEICRWGKNRIKAVESGAVFVLIEHLLFDKFSTSSERRSCELVLVLLDQLCGCAEGRAELLKHGAGVAIVSKKVLRVSQVATCRAVRILASIARFSATTRVLQEMLQVGVVSKLCLVVQVDGNGKTKERAKEILRLHSRVWKKASCVPPYLLSSYP
ncbi:RING-type E3 ubiquitin transferase [Heracleum sosnowskyi]|uniref:U-box domain-containing protein n=1 Tax=Heracleum sosnowskyi TaxID=360622 RepID=A0AAD8LXV6_9APIA|nr:RING-type E3 ubiquitin transferase [Heracleum sosnowskyi]